MNNMSSLLNPKKLPIKQSTRTCDVHVYIENSIMVTLLRQEVRVGSYSDVTFVEVL